MDPALDGGAGPGAAVGVIVAVDPPLAARPLVLAEEPDAPPERTAVTGGSGAAGCAPAAGAADDEWLAEDTEDIGVVIAEEEFSGATPPNAEPAGCDAPVLGAVATGAGLDAGCGAVIDAATSRDGGERLVGTFGALAATTTATAAVATFATSAVEAEDPRVPTGLTSQR